MFYTLRFRLPFLICLITLYSTLGTWGTEVLMIGPDKVKDNLFMVLGILVFGVKLPILGLHFWLPVAHVEAPTFGSILLAGILLKLGGAGLIRIQSFMEIHIPLRYIFVLLLCSYRSAGLLCYIQSDFKKLIAYSSIFHIALVPLLLRLGSTSREGALILLIFTHGLISPLLFLTVGIVLRISGTRQLTNLRGISILHSNLYLSLTILFFRTIPTPPFLSFTVEILSLMRILSHRASYGYSLIIGIFLALLYNLNWFLALSRPFSKQRIPVRTARICELNLININLSILFLRMFCMRFL